MLVTELKPGQLFKIKGQRKFRLCVKKIEVDLYDDDGTKTGEKGILVILPKCRQWVLRKDTEIFLDESPVPKEL